MTKQNKAELFEEWYGNYFQKRWATLRDALGRDPHYTSITTGLKKAYYLDDASRIAAEHLEIPQNGKVLDLCAAPGGKTLVLASQLGETGTLTANDRSAARRNRLKSVLDEHLPAELRKMIIVTGHDASRWCRYEQDAYDRILLDVPCSSERHVLSSPAHLSRWSPARVKRLAQQGYAMLSSALRVVKPGGFILFCTCALTHFENDGVVSRLLKRYGDQISPATVASSVGESTEHGRQIFPDAADGRGPMYFSLLRRKC